MSLDNKIKTFWIWKEIKDGSKHTDKRGWSLPERVGIAGAAPGSDIHENLEELAKYLTTLGNGKKRWSVAMVESKPSYYKINAKIGSGWYTASTWLISQTGYMPLEEAEKLYEQK